MFQHLLQISYFSFLNNKSIKAVERRYRSFERWYNTRYRFSTRKNFLVLNRRYRLGGTFYAVSRWVICTVFIYFKLTNFRLRKLLWSRCNRFNLDFIKVLLYRRQSNADRRSLCDLNGILIKLWIAIIMKR